MPGDWTPSSGNAGPSEWRQRLGLPGALAVLCSTPQSLCPACCHPMLCPAPHWQGGLLSNPGLSAWCQGPRSSCHSLCSGACATSPCSGRRSSTWIPLPVPVRLCRGRLAFTVDSQHSSSLPVGLGTGCHHTGCAGGSCRQLPNLLSWMAWRKTVGSRGELGVHALVPPHCPILSLADPQRD